MTGCKQINTPIEPNSKFGVHGESPINKGQYQWLVRKLIYLSHTRWDIRFAVSVVF